MRDAASVRDLEAFHTDFHLLDAAVPGQRGGTGQSFSWELAAAHRGAVPMILAGGMNPDNVAEAIRVTSPFAVDTASGTEAAPGRKDPAKVAAFFRAVKATEPEPEPSTA